MIQLPVVLMQILTVNKHDRYTCSYGQDISTTQEESYKIDWISSFPKEKNK